MKQEFKNIIKVDGKTIIMLYGEVGEGCSVDSNRVVSELFAIENQGCKIEVRINSQGGDVFSGMAIYNALRQSKSDIKIYIDGVAASIAAIIALCGKPLFMSPYAKLMLHNVSGGTYGNASELRQTAEQMEVLQTNLATMVAERLGMTAEAVVEKYFDGEDHWISASEALDMKLIDGIYEMDEVKDAPTTTEGMSPSMPEHITTRTGPRTANSDLMYGRFLTEYQDTSCPGSGTMTETSSGNCPRRWFQ